MEGTYVFENLRRGNTASAGVGGAASGWGVCGWVLERGGGAGTGACGIRLACGEEEEVVVRLR